jgi:hypothetical protein
MADELEGRQGAVRQRDALHVDRDDASRERTAPLERLAATLA